ncbi:MAG: electron transport complex subunit RsxC [Bacillota bacterium]|nr:electron transport complex subunit RsxC [Bacillota bacterium]MDW7677851.1 electron transport complex subunit RsxC [Bacillota bacterium]
MQIKTFKGGAHIPHYKEYTEHKKIQPLSLPEYVYIPLLQHWGVANQAIVKPGDRVTVGQKIGDSSEYFSAPVHSSVNGVVEAIDMFPCYEGGERLTVKIRAEGSDQSFVPSVQRNPDEMTPDELRLHIREAGLVGMGGAAFPTHANINPRSPVDTLLVNGAECEPFLTCDHRIMLERADDLVAGIRIMMRCIGATRCFIGIEVNKPDAIETLTQKTESIEDITIVPLEVKYPQGYKSHLIKAVTGRDVPRGARSADLGCVVRNVGTTVAGYDAVVYGKPLIERVVTVSGPKISKPGNYMIRIGTPIEFVLDQCGVTELEGHKVILGGPMTGIAQSTLETAIVKSTTGVLVLPPEMAVEEVAYTDCVRCGKCVEHCPMLLYPNQLSIYAEAGMLNELMEWNALDCMDCGICSYICPGHRPIADMIRRIQPELKKKQRSRKTG